MTRRFDRLVVLWRDADGRRHVIGDLWRESDGRFAFGYRPDLDGARNVGFERLPEFREERLEDAPYRSSYLFPTFAQRIPSPKRSDRAALLREWGVDDADDPMEILARSGGIQLTDSLELAEYRPEDDDLRRPLEFRLAGRRHFGASARLKEGTLLRLRREPTNDHDSSATLVLLVDGEPVGYVPRQYSAMVARLLDQGAVLATRTVRRHLLPEELGPWVLEISRDQTK